MATRGSRGGRRGGYVFRFIGTAALLVAGTLALVLYVLPERYVLSSGFREGALHLPNPSVPFEPAPPLRIAAIPGMTDGFAAATGEDPVRGPAELFWESVLPLLEAERYEEAIRLFTEYLSRHPGDPGVGREYGITLAAAGYPERAIPVLEGLLEVEDDDALHLLLARLLRDADRVDEAVEHYTLLIERSPDDVDLVVELARALSGIPDYPASEAVLLDALERDPGSVPLRAELVLVYYLADRLEEALALLDAMTEAEIETAGLTVIRANVVEWLTPVPDTTTVAPPTLLERAVRAREDDDFETADSLYREALAEDPADVGAWRAYADFLQYELEDFEGALAALEEVDGLTDGPDPALRYRMAQLEIWTDRLEPARQRLEALLADLPSGGAAAGRPAAGDTLATGFTPTLADVHALLGDLGRWNGERLEAVESYYAALEEDPDHQRAGEGLDILRADLDRFIAQSERPGLGAVASTLADTDDFERYDAGGLWAGIHGEWVWSTRSGGRWLSGLEPAGGSGSRSGLFAELEGGRWWRWGTVRTAAHLGVQNVRSNSTDLSIGASFRLVGDSGRRTDVSFDHQPAYVSARTLQSLAADVRQDRLTLSHSQPLSERWSAAVTAEAASLDHRAVGGADRNLRLQLAASIGRVLSPSLTLGLSSRALRYRDAAPDATAVRLYWDPELSVSAGPYLQLRQPLGTWWSATAQLNPGLAYIDERGRATEVVPDLSGRLGLAREGARYRTSIELFYGQGRFSGYRSYGVDLSFSARGWLGPGVGR